MLNNMNMVLITLLHVTLITLDGKSNK